MTQTGCRDPEVFWLPRETDFNEVPAQSGHCFQHTAARALIVQESLPKEVFMMPYVAYVVLPYKV